MVSLPLYQLAVAYIAVATLVKHCEASAQGVIL